MFKLRNVLKVSFLSVLPCLNVYGGHQGQPLLGFCGEAEGTPVVLVITNQEPAEALGVQEGLEAEGFVQVDLQNGDNQIVPNDAQVQGQGTCSNVLQSVLFTLEIVGGAILLHPCLPSNLRVSLWSLSTTFVGTFAGFACYAQKQGKPIDELISSYKLIAAGGAYFGVDLLISALVKCG